MQYRIWIGRRELEEGILKSITPNLVIFAAKWCGACKRFLTVVDEYPEEANQPEVSVVDTDDGDGTLWEKYRINVVPTIVMFKDGKEIFRKEGWLGSGLRVADFTGALKVLSP